MASAFSRTVTIDHTKVPTAQTDFPVLVSGTYAYLATIANGGKVQSGSGWDVGFYSDAALTTKLKWEIERWTATTGEVIYWVKIPTVSSASDTVFYMAYGDAGISTDQSDKVNVWDANFKRVYHLPDGSTLTVKDSTSGANDGTNNGATAVTGNIGGGSGHVAASTQYIEIPSTALPTVGPVTVSAWIKIASKTAEKKCVAAWDDTGTKFNFLLTISGATFDKPTFAVREVGALNVRTSDHATAMATGTWYKVVGKIDGGTTAKIYLNNAGPGTPNTFADSSAAATVASIGAGQNGAARNNPHDGSIDEVRISDIMRSDDWETTSYNNESNPATFYTVGAEQALGRQQALTLLGVGI